MKKWAIFDFDGTIANTIDLLYKNIDEFGEKIGWESLEIDDIKKIRDFDIMDLIVRIRLSPFFMWKIKRRLKKEMNNVKSYPGIDKLIERLEARGIHSAIISSNSVSNINKFLIANKIENIHSVHSEPDLTGKGEKIKKFMKKHNIDPVTAIYIGDEVRDIKAARKAEIEVCSVTWGFNSEKRLLEDKPDFLANDMDQLFDVITAK